MFRKITSGLAAFVLAATLACGLATATTATAQTVTVQQPFTGTSFQISSGFETVGQTVLVPAGVSRLQRFTVRVVGDVTPVVRAYDNATQTVGAVLHTGTPHTGSWSDVETVIPSGGIEVTPGSHIYIGATQTMLWAFGGIAATTNEYPDGIAHELRLGVNTPDPGLDLYFIATFGPEPAPPPPPPPPPVPTLSEWAMILLGLTLAGGAALAIQRRRLMV